MCPLGGRRLTERTTSPEELTRVVERQPCTIVASDYHFDLPSVYSSRASVLTLHQIKLSTTLVHWSKVSALNKIYSDHIPIFTTTQYKTDVRIENSYLILHLLCYLYPYKQYLPPQLVQLSSGWALGYSSTFPWSLSQ